MTQVDTKAPPPDAVFAMSLALYEPELTGNLDNTYCENLIKALAKHGYTMRRETTAPDGVAKQPEAQSAPAMTEAELERELMSKAWQEVPMGGVSLLTVEDAMIIAKKYAARV